MAAAEAIQKRLLRTALSLPAPLLRAASGGGAVYAGGRTLDPRFQVLMHAARRRPGGAVYGETSQPADFALLRGEAEPGVSCREVTLDGPRGPIASHLYRPKAQDAAAAMLVFAHVEAASTQGDPMQALCGMLAGAAAAPVLSLAHALVRHPGLDAGLEDLLTALRWAQENGVAHGAAERLAAVGGDGLGANIAAAACQMLKGLGERQPEAQLLLYPAVDMTSESASTQTFADAAVLAPALAAWREGRLISASDSPHDPRVSPLRAHDLSGLAPAVIATAGFDPLFDQGESYARKLRAAGVTVRYRCFDHLPHGFAAFAGVPAAEAACRDIAAMAAGVLSRPVTAPGAVDTIAPVP
jgi:acetyl esterase/lipase